jgi:hypothetical protein
MFGYTGGEMKGLHASILSTPEDRAGGVPGQTASPNFAPPSVNKFSGNSPEIFDPFRVNPYPRLASS